MITYTLDSPEIQALCAADTQLALLIRFYGELSYTPHPDPFVHTVENIIGQMLSSKAADAIATRLYNLCGGTLTADAVLNLHVPALRGIGLSANKAGYILNIAALTNDQPGFFNSLRALSDEDVIKKLTALRGLGTWSAKMYLIFVLDRPDVLPYEDGAFLQAYKWLYNDSNISVTPAAIIEKCAPWTPYSSIAARYLYRALDSGLTRDTALTDKISAVTQL
jgi:DNA-3-methyladenine glycosylase II